MQFSLSNTIIAVFIAIYVMLLSGCGGAGNTTPLANTTTPIFTTAPAMIALTIGQQSPFEVGGGGGGQQFTTYTATSSNSNVAQVSITGTTFSVRGAGPGTATIVVQDAAGGTVNINAIVSPAPSTSTNLPFISAPSFVFLAENASNTYAVGGGAGNYTAATSDSAVATASITGSTLIVTGIKRGTVNVVLFDGAGNTAGLTVSVGDSSSIQSLYTTSPSFVTLAVGATPSYLIAGGVAPYTAASSNPSVVTATTVLSALQLTAAAPGATSVDVIDANGTIIPIFVTVEPGTIAVPFFTTAPSDVTLTIGQPATYRLLGGTGPYLVSSSAPSSISAVIFNADEIVLSAFIADTGVQITAFDSTGSAVRITANSVNAVP
jgi:hypothetical protein